MPFIDIPPQIQLMSTIREGSVFYFVEESFVGDVPHYFVVLNKQPLIDPTLVLVCSVTFDIKVYQQIDKSPFPKQTFIDVTPDQCSFLSKISLFNCNNVIQKGAAELVEKLENKELKMIGYIEKVILDKLKIGVRTSPLVEREIKKYI